MISLKVSHIFLNYFSREISKKQNNNNYNIG